MPPIGAHVRGEFGMMAVKRQERKIRKEKDAENVYARVRRIGKGSFGSVDLVQDKVRSELRGSPLSNLASDPTPTDLTRMCMLPTRRLVANT